MRLEKTKILENKAVFKNHFLLTLNCPHISKEVKPGQFINIQVSDGLDPFLKRPMSVCFSKGKKIKIFYRVQGKGTKQLSKRRVGEQLNIAGPFGNGFSEPKNKKVCIVAGGCGIAPLMLLLPKIKNKHSLIIYGAKNKSQLFGKEWIQKIGIRFEIATDDGSAGEKKSAPQVLAEVLKKGNFDSIITCGPKIMMQKVSKIASEKNITCEVSLEENMACGVGACLGCVVKTKSGFKTVCKDGPVFRGKEVQFD